MKDEQIDPTIVEAYTYGKLSEFKKIETTQGFSKDIKFALAHENGLREARGLLHFLEKIEEDTSAVETALEGLKGQDPYLGILRSEMEKNKDYVKQIYTGYLKGYLDAGEIICWPNSGIRGMVFRAASKLEMKHFLNPNI